MLEERDETSDVYRPAEGGPVPFLLSRLPYSKVHPMMVQSTIDAQRAVQAGYAVVLQDKPFKPFVMGLDQWREEDDWPLPDTQFRHYYLHSGGHANSAAGHGTLSTEAQAAKVPEDAYLYDPRRPIPTVGGAILLLLGLDQGPRDQRNMESRDDVLCCSSAPLEHPVEVTGPIELVLYISSSALPG